MWMYVNSFRLCVCVCVCVCVCGYLSGQDYAMDPLKMVSKKTETCRGKF